ncbi:MAG: SDR family oxidoreductase [Desulfobacterales bacterium]|nr:SDR family oxidoreductase [Desulfobacterales bacterium]
MKSRPQILVTGAGGILSQQVIKRLKSSYRIVAVDFRQRVTIDDIPTYQVSFNKRGFEDIFRNHDFSGVIHLGRIGAFAMNRFSRYNANVLGTQKLLDLCLKYGVGQVLVLSTYFVYGAHAYNPALIDETFPLKASELTRDLVDSVELENLATIYLWKYPELNITLLRPCNIAGPGVKNSLSQILKQERAPVLMGFSPLMQFIHVEDMAEAIIVAFQKNKPAIYNVAPDDWITYQDAVIQCGCSKMQIPSIPNILPLTLSKLISSTFRKFINWKMIPSYLLNYFKYPVIIDGSLFKKTFGFVPAHSLDDIFKYYRDVKQEMNLLAFVPTCEQHHDDD